MSFVCEHLPWDTEFFGVAVAKVVGGRMDVGQCRTIFDWCEKEGVRFLYFLSDDDVASCAIAAEAGFRLVDVRVRLVLDRTWPRLPAPAPSPGVVLREATESDLTDLLPIAASVHTDSRFFADPAVPREKARELFTSWLRRSVEHVISDIVFVAEVDGRAVAYITARLTGTSGTIGLVGVGGEVRGRGIGMAMVHRALDWFAAGGAQEVSVVTQGRNIMAQRVYQRSGFLTASVSFWFHKWFRRA